MLRATMTPSESLVLTLVTADHTALDLALAARDALRHAGARTEEVIWLEPSQACDIPFRAVASDLDAARHNVAGDAASAERIVRDALDGIPVDLVVQPRSDRRKRLLVADMESTVIRNEMLEELADHVGARKEVEEVTRRAMNGELDFRQALEERVALLADLPTSVLEDCLGAIRVDPGARTLVATMRRHGARTALVSGGFVFFARWVAERVGFEEVRANRLETAGPQFGDGHLTGRVLEPVLDRDAKVRFLHQLCQEHGLRPHETLAVGDGANDLAMIRDAGLGVAFHGKPKVAMTARHRIDHGDLSTLLYFQGYRRAEFART